MLSIILSKNLFNSSNIKINKYNIVPINIQEKLNPFEVRLKVIKLNSKNIITEYKKERDLLRLKGLNRTKFIIIKMNRDIHKFKTRFGSIINSKVIKISNDRRVSIKIKLEILSIFLALSLTTLIYLSTKVKISKIINDNIDKLNEI
jgi:hypothetical protein